MDFLNIGKLKETISEFVKIKLELFKLDITEHLSKVLAQVIAYMVIFFMGMFVFAYATIALANYLNGLFMNTYGGYLVMSGFFLIILLVILYFLQSGKLKDFIESKLIGEDKEDIKDETNG